MSVLVTGGAGYIGGHMALGLLDAGETVVVLDNLSTGFAWGVPEGAKLVVGDTGDTDLVARLIKEHAIDAIAHFAAKIVVPELGSRSARLLPQQRFERARPDRGGRQWRGEDVHLFLDRGRLWRNWRRSRVGGNRARADFALWPLEAHGRMDARGRVPGLRFSLRRAALFQCRRRRSQGPPRPVDAQRDPSDQARRPDGARDSIRRSRYSARTIRPAMAPACATISRSPTSSTRI